MDYFQHSHLVDNQRQKIIDEYIRTKEEMHTMSWRESNKMISDIENEIQKEIENEFIRHIEERGREAGKIIKDMFKEREEGYDDPVHIVDYVTSSPPPKKFKDIENVVKKIKGESKMDLKCIDGEVYIPAKINDKQNLAMEMVNGEIFYQLAGNFLYASIYFDIYYAESNPFRFKILGNTNTESEDLSGGWETYKELYVKKDLKSLIKEHCPEGIFCKVSKKSLAAAQESNDIRLVKYTENLAGNYLYFPYYAAYEFPSDYWLVPVTIEELNKYVLNLENV